MKIRLPGKDILINASYKLAPQMKEELDAIARREGVTQGDIVRSFLEFAMRAYRSGRVHRIYSDSLMNHFRKQIKKGDEVIAAGIKGVVEEAGELFFRVKIAEQTVIEIARDELTDVLNPRADLVNEMQRFRDAQKQAKQS